MAASATLTPTADPNVFAFSIPTTLKTAMDIPVTIPMVGACQLAVDTTAGASPTVNITGQVTFSSDRLRMGLQSMSPVTGLEGADVRLSGDPGCGLTGNFLSFAADILRTTFQAHSFANLCRPCGSTGVAQCLP